MIESRTERQDSSPGQVDEDYGRPNKRQRMSVEPSGEMPTLGPQRSVDVAPTLEQADTDEEEFQAVEVTRASDLYLDTVCFVISIAKPLFHSHCSKD